MRLMGADAAPYFALTVLAALLRLPTLSLQSFWLDEGYTVHLVRMSLGGMMSTIPHTESTPPLYYILAWGWTHLFGSGEWGLRSLSALAGTAVVPVTFAIAERLAGRPAAWLAGGLAATSPLLVWFSQEARAYALATLLAAGTVLFLLRYLDQGGPRWLAAWAVCAALGLATHYFVAFLVIGEAIYLWAHRYQGDTRRVVLSLAAVGAVALALVPLALAQQGTGNAEYIGQGGLVTRIVQVPKQLLLGYASPGQVLTAALAVVLIAVALSRTGGARLRGNGVVGAATVITVFALLAPIALAVIGVDFLNTRNLQPALPAALVLLATAIGPARDGDRDRDCRGRLGPAASVLLCLLLALVVVLVDADRRYQRDDWRGAARALGHQPALRAIAITPAASPLPLEAYQTSLAPLRHLVSVRELDVISLPVHSTGHGLGAAARPWRWLRVPSQFRIATVVLRPTYTIVRYVARLPAVIRRRSVQAGRRGVTLLLQSPNVRAIDRSR